jgi:MYND finger/SET domain
MDPSKHRFCACCYEQVSGSLLRCGKCMKRIYCSKECQIKDWKEYSHRFYCQKTGEIGHDFEIRRAEGGKGLGMFALREFERNEIIVAERPLLVFDAIQVKRSLWLPKVPADLESAIATLHPLTGSFEEKFDKNAFAYSDPDEVNHVQGLFLVMSRINHDCIGNSSHQFMWNRGVKILVANHSIKVGEEITFSYGSPIPSQVRRRQLELKHGIVCICRACRDKTVASDLDEILECERHLAQTFSRGMTDMSIKLGLTIIGIYDKYQLPSCQYHRTYFDLFQAAISKQSRFDEAVQYICKSYQAALDYTSDPDDIYAHRIKRYVDNPRSHYNYCIYERRPYY